MLEEVEAPHRAKAERLAREAEAAQEAFVRLRREREALANAYRVGGRDRPATVNGLGGGREAGAGERPVYEALL